MRFPRNWRTALAERLPVDDLIALGASRDRAQRQSILRCPWRIGVATLSSYTIDAGLRALAPMHLAQSGISRGVFRRNDQMRFERPPLGREDIREIRATGEV